MNKKTLDGPWREHIECQIDQFSIASRYYIYKNLFDNALDIAENLNDHTRWVISHLINIEVKKFEMLPGEECNQFLSQEIRLEKKLNKNLEKEKEK